MTTINKEGMLVDKTVILKRYPNIEHGLLSGVHAIVVHQTDTSAPNILLIVIMPEAMARIS